MNRFAQLPPTFAVSKEKLVWRAPTVRESNLNQTAAKTNLASESQDANGQFS